MSDSYTTGLDRVVTLVNETGAIVPSHTKLGSTQRDGKAVPLGFRRVSRTDTDRGLCYKRAIGFAYGKTGDKQPELRTLVDFETGTNTEQFLEPIARHWEQRGYTVNRDGLKERFPKVKAIAGDYTIYATALTETAGFGTSPKLTIYAVGRCARP